METKDKVATKTTKWKERGFMNRQHYINWLFFNSLSDETRLYDDIYMDSWTGKVVNIMEDLEESDDGKDSR